jgi:FkbM family methyltransferase
LLCGLDERSQDIVVTSVNRLKRLAASTRPVDIFTDSEKKIRGELRDNFTRKIIKLDENLFYYKGYFLPKNYFSSGMFYFDSGMTLLQNTKAVKENNIIDVGAYIGDSAIFLSKYTEKKVYAFEALSENFVLMRKTIELNSLANIVPVCSALGEEHGETVLHILPDFPSIATSKGKFTLHSDDDKKCETEARVVSVETLDRYVEKNNITVGLIKVDIEGAEQLFLQGAIKTIRRDRPALLISIYHNPDDFFDIKPLIEGWDLGYHFSIFSNPATFLVDMMLVAEVPSG